MNQIVLILIIITVLFSIKGFNDASFFNKYKFQVNRILNGEQLRMLTAGFLHANWLHLGFNMYALYLFGKIVATNLGATSFLLIYFTSLLAGSAYSLYFHKNESFYSAVGASGAVSGIVYAAIMIYPNMELIMLPIPIPIPGYIFAVGYLVYSIYGMKKQLGNIGHSAHLGGAIAGFLLTLLLYPTIFLNNQLLIFILAIPIIGLLFFGKKIKNS